MPIEPGLLACPGCHADPTADPEIKLSSIQIRAIGKSLRGEFLKGFLWWLGILSLLFGFGLLQVYLNATKRLEDIMVQRISAEFMEPRIRETISSVASNYASAAIISQIEPEVTRFKDEIRLSASNTHTLVEATREQLADIDNRVNTSKETEIKLQSALDEANLIIKQLKELSDFMITASSAEYDDRESFEKLKQWALDPDYPLKTRALTAFLQIRGDFWGERGKKNWASTADISKLFPETLTLEQVRQNWQSTAPMLARDFIQRVWDHPGLSKENKLEFMHDVLENSRNSLLTADAAARFLAAEGSLNYNPAFEFGVIEDWWATRMTTNTLGQQSGAGYPPQGVGSPDP